MTDEDPTQDRIAELLARINQMDEMLRQQAWRLYHLEQRLGMAPPPQPQPQQPVARPPRTAPHAHGTPPTAPPETNRMPPVPPAQSFGPMATEPPSLTQPAEPGGAEPPRRPETTPPMAPPASMQPPVPPVFPQPPTPPRVPAQQPIPPAYAQPPVPPSGVTPSVPPMSYAQPKAKPHGNLETRIGGNWFNRIGIIAVALGMAFFLKYAIDNQWITPWGRVIIGLVVGLGFIAGGEFLRSRYRNYAYGLTGGGILILYISFYAAYQFLSLIDALPTFICMALVTAAASLLAGRYNALPIAILGLIGGFLTPVLLSTHQNNEAGLFGYITLLDLGVLALAYSKRWRSLNYLAFAATVVMFFAWWADYYTPDQIKPTMAFLTVFFGIFALLAVLYSVINRRPTRWLDLAMVFANALLYFSASYGLLSEQYRASLGLFAVLVSAFYLALGYVTYQRDREDRLLLYTFWGLAILFAIMAVPIQFHQQWITMGWAIEGAILTWVGLRVNDRISRYGGLAVFFVAVSHWLIMDLFDFAYRTDVNFVPLLNPRALSCAVLVAALAAASVCYKRLGEQIEAGERQMFMSLYTLGANGLAIALLTLDAKDYFEQKAARLTDPAARIESMKQFVLSAVWIIYGALACLVGLRRKRAGLRITALALLTLATFKLLLVDLRHYAATWHVTLLNPMFAAFALLVAALVVIAWFYRRAEMVGESERRQMIPFILGAANVLALVSLSAEIVGYFLRSQASLQQHATGVASSEVRNQIAQIDNDIVLMLSVLWIIYGAVALVIGIRRNLKWLRLGALSLLAVTTIKVMMFDLSYYAAPWHQIVFNQTFAAFALLVAALAAGAWFYARAANLHEDERRAAIPVLIVSANILAVLALSAESFGHYAMQIASAPAEDLRDLRLAQQLWLTVVWTVYGGALLTIGLVRRKPMLRIMALALLGMTIAKVYLMDIWSLAKLYRIIALILLGGVLLLVSFLYQPLRRRLMEDGDGDGNTPDIAGTDADIARQTE